MCEAHVLVAGVTAFIVNAGNNQDVTSVDKVGSCTESSIVNAGPGRFYLDLNTANADNAVVVEDCVDSDDDDVGGGGGGDNDRNRNRNNDNNRNTRVIRIDDNDRNNRNNRVVVVGGAATRQYGEDKIIVKTIPYRGTLANTGGSPLIFLAGAALLSTGLLLGCSVIRRAL